MNTVTLMTPDDDRPGRPVHAPTWPDQIPAADLVDIRDEEVGPADPHAPDLGGEGGGA